MTEQAQLAAHPSARIYTAVNRIKHPGQVGDGWVPSEADYYSDGIGSTGTKDFWQDPAAFYRKYVARTEPDSQTKFMRQGSIVDIMVTEGTAKARKIWGVTGNDRRLKATKQQIAEVEASGREAVTQKEWTQAQNCAEAVAAHPFASRLLRSPEITNQWSYMWVEESFGLRLRGRADALATRENHRFGTDLKVWSGSGAGVDVLPHLIRKWRTHWQLELYSRAVEHCYGWRPKWFLTTVDPATYQVHVHELAYLWFERARKDLNRIYSHMALLFQRYRDEPRAWCTFHEMQPTTIPVHPGLAYEEDIRVPAHQLVDRHVEQQDALIEATQTTEDEEE